MGVYENNLDQLIVDYDLYSLHMGPTCLKSVKGRCIALMLTNKKHSFFHSQSFETGFSGHHHLIYTILKSAFVKVPPKIVTSCDYKAFNEEKSLTDLSDALLRSFSAAYSQFKKMF